MQRIAPKSVLIWATCLLGLVSLACAIPADDGAPQWGIDPVETPRESAPWTPSEEWLQLYERDAEVRDLLAQSLDEDDRQTQLDLYDDYRESKNALQDYFVQNPDADAPCETLVRYAPPAMWCTADDLQLEANLT